MRHRLNAWLPLLLAVAVAIAFRFPLLDSLPPGLNFDEGGEGIAALDVMHGTFKVMWPIGGGKEPLMAYLVQPLFWLFGPTRLALRLYAALWGLGAVLATYFLAGQLWPANRNDRPGKAALAWVPAFAAFGLATAFWHVAYSRIAFRALSNPAVEALALGFLWRALRSGRWRDFLLAGFFTGSLIYTYLPGRFVPLGIALFFGVEVARAWSQGQKPLLLQYWQKLAVMVGMAILVFLPMAIFFIQNPGTFGQRARAVSIFSPAMHQGDFWGTLWRTTLKTLGTFVALTGDPNELANIPGRPELGPLLAILLLVGIGLALYRWRKPPYLFLLTWWPVMLLPAILAPEDAPHHLRLIGTAPGTYIFVGLGLSQIVYIISTQISARWSALGQQQWQNYLSWLFLALVFGLAALRTYRDYFIHWANEVDHYLAFDVYAEELAEHIAADTEPGVTYAIPMDLRAAHEARHYSLDFLSYGQTSYDYVVVDEGTVGRSLTEAVRGSDKLRLVRWTADKHREADVREVVTFLLETGGAALVDWAAYPVYTIETYQLPATDTQFALPAIETPIEVTLDDLIQIRRAAVLSRATVGGQIAVAVTYARIAPTEVDYKASLRLVGPAGATVAQLDRTLRHNWHQSTSLWPAEEVNEYYLLPLPPDLVPGLYEVRLVIYHPETLAPLTDNGVVEVSLGQVEVKRET